MVVLIHYILKTIVMNTTFYLVSTSINNTNYY